MHPRWAGRCESCGEWNTIIQEAVASRPGPAAKGSGCPVDFVNLDGSAELPPRCPTGIAELDRVLGGGLVPASAILVGGDPGIGKSTLLLQAAAALARTGRRVLYISGEESIEQTRLRARGSASRIRRWSSPQRSTYATCCEPANRRRCGAGRDDRSRPCGSIIDSAPGTVAQVRACSFELIQLAKAGRFAVVLVGHVTKDGAIAGPRVLEHMVDAVLYFEGDRGHQFRILRGVKNRFGATDEIGVFEMTDQGLAEVAESLRPVPGRAARQHRRQRRVRRGRRHTPCPGGSAGAARTEPGRPAAPIRDWLGWRQVADAACGAGGTRRPAAELH